MSTIEFVDKIKDAVNTAQDFIDLMEVLRASLKEGEDLERAIDEWWLNENK